MEYKIREWRHELLWTQTHLSKRARVRRQTISEIEHGLRNPGHETVRRIAKTLGISIRLLRRGPLKAESNHRAA